MDELSDVAAIELGRITYFAGHADHYLGLLAAQAIGAQRAQGLSGTRLADTLQSLAETSPPLKEILGAYGPMYERRNVLVHGTHHYAGDVLWTWFIPQQGKGDTALSFQHRLEDLRYMADSWQRLAEAAHEFVHAAGE